jgi:NAD(P)H-hydrate epimerase
MRACDSAATRKLGLSVDLLMEHAGLGVVAAMERRYGSFSGTRVAILCGKGHNGGDGLVIARLLALRGARVTAVLCSPRKDLAAAVRVQAARFEALLDPARGSSECRLVEARTIRALSSLEPGDLIVDALFGTGFHGTPGGFPKRAIAWMNGRPEPTVAVDVPSGLDSDGEAPRGLVVQADFTVTFQARKLGLLAAAGQRCAGAVEVADLGIPPQVVARNAGTYRRLDAVSISASLPLRAVDAHKHSVGKVLVIAGATGYAGAAIMTAQAALRAGAGAVILCAPRSLYGVLSRRLTEVMVMPVAESAAGTFSRASLQEVAPHAVWADVVVVGPGISRQPEASLFVRELLPLLERNTILDADALNAFAGNAAALRRPGRNLVVTPHAGECARLAGLRASEVERKRFTLPQEIARELGATVVLKGAPTVISGPKSPMYINATGNPGMATAGSGDVLTGILSGFWAQGMSAVEASCAAVFAHGLAGDLAAGRYGTRSLLALDILEALPEACVRLERAGKDAPR